MNNRKKFQKQKERERAKHRKVLLRRAALRKDAAVEKKKQRLERELADKQEPHVSSKLQELLQKVEESKQTIGLGIRQPESPVRGESANVVILDDNSKIPE